MTVSKSLIPVAKPRNYGLGIKALGNQDETAGPSQTGHAATSPQPGRNVGSSSDSSESASNQQHFRDLFLSSNTKSLATSQQAVPPGAAAVPSRGTAERNLAANSAGLSPAANPGALPRRYHLARVDLYLSHCGVEATDPQLRQAVARFETMAPPLLNQELHNLTVSWRSIWQDCLTLCKRAVSKLKPNRARELQDVALVARAIADGVTLNISELPAHLRPPEHINDESSAGQ